MLKFPLAGALVLLLAMFAMAWADSVPVRQPWTTSRVVGTPEPPLPYVAEQVFPKLRFESPVLLARTPELNRLFVAELNGRIYSFVNEPDCERADLVIDLREHIPGAEQIYGMAFHPKFAQNQYVYVCYVLAPELPEGTRVSRFRLASLDPPQIDPQSEQILITWLSGGHNGGCLEFGPDGYLYISTGDAVGPNPPDTLQTGQDVSDLLSSVLRIDVDQETETTPYAIPPDNPFIDLEKARPEVWAYGLRNPWKMTFDRVTGDLWLGDVGWELWELVFRIERGGNYGWSIMEGRQPIDPNGRLGPTPIQPPVVDHPHSEAASVTGGYVYYGRRLPELSGAYIYGDYETGKLWGLRYQDGQVTWHQELADTTFKIICFGEDHEGELYFMDYVGGTLHQLVPNPQADQPSQFPRRLSETGLFLSVPEHEPAVGVMPYEIAAQPWADGALTERWVAVPGLQSIRVTQERSDFPAGSVLLKTFLLETEPGNADSRRRIETQLLHFDGLDWRGYTYAWNDEQTDAELVSADGLDRSLKIRDPSAAGGERVQVWRYASRAECMRCHNSWSGMALGWNGLQLSSVDTSGRSPLRELQQLGLVRSEVPENAPHLVNPYDDSFGLEQRARSYLHANCAHCHRLHAGGSVLSQMQYDIPLANASLLDFPPSQGTFGLDDARVITPGDPASSVLLYRMAKSGSGHMPRIGSYLVDPQGVGLVWNWIAQLDSPTDAVQRRARREEQQKLLDVIRRKSHSGKLDQAQAASEQLLSSSSGALLLMHELDRGAWDPATLRQIAEQGANHSDVIISDLFVRYLPEAASGPADREAILALQGDPQRGAKLYHSDRLQCRTCHRLESTGQAVGPDLTQIGRKYDRRQLLESLVDPSKVIDPQYRTYIVETTSGQIFLGLLVRRTADEVVLRDAKGFEQIIAADEVDSLTVQPHSLMPEQLLRGLSPEEMADLLAYLESLK